MKSRASDELVTNKQVQATRVSLWIDDRLSKIIDFSETEVFKSEKYTGFLPESRELSKLRKAMVFVEINGEDHLDFISRTPNLEEAIIFVSRVYPPEGVLFDHPPLTDARLIVDLEIYSYPIKCTE